MKTLMNILLITWGVLGTSCQDWLDVKPKSEVKADVLFETEAGFKDALSGVYLLMTNSSAYGLDLTLGFNDVLARQYTLNSTFCDYYDESEYRYEKENVESRIARIWLAQYNTIANVNNILENLKGYDEDALPLYNVYKAECLGLRGFMHFDLLRLFSENIVNNQNAQGIPYVDNYSFEVSPFLSAEAAYGRIIGDLKAAEDLMLKNGEYFEDAEQQNNEFLKDRAIHMNLYAIQGILARVYWMKGELKTAAEYAQKVLDCGYFELADKSEIQDLVNGVLSPKETIWGLFSSTFYTDVRSILYLTGSPTCLFLKAEHDEDYNADKEGTDYRYDKWFNSYNQVEASGMRCIKILDTYELTYSSRKESRVKGINMLRLPELYYIITEYYLSIDRPDEAIKYYDKVMVSRGLTAYADRQGVTLTLEQVIRERKKELIGEGQYFFTLKRYNQDILETKSGKTYKASNDIYVLPIPENEIEYRY